MNSQRVDIQQFAEAYVFTRKLSLGMEKLIQALLPEAHRVKNSDFTFNNILIEIRISTSQLSDGAWHFRSSPLSSHILICIGATKEDIKLWCLHKKDIKTKFLRLKENDGYSVRPEELKKRVEELGKK